MKAVILAGGFGTRISEETDLKPKPMIEIGGKPILWHIMKMYSHHGVTDLKIVQICTIYGLLKIGKPDSQSPENSTNFRGAARGIMQMFAARMHAYLWNLIQ